MRIIFLVISALVILVACGQRSDNTGPSPVASPRSIDIGGRLADVNFQPGLERLDQPLVIALHGLTGNSKQFANQIGLDRDVNRAGIRVALLNGQLLPRTRNKRFWNSSLLTGGGRADDLAYLDLVIQTLQLGATGAGRRVVLVGHSNGSMMSYAYMCKRPGKVFGVVGVSGTVAFSGSECLNSNARLIHVHGTDDDVVPISGDPNPNDSLRFKSLADQREIFAMANLNYNEILVNGRGHKLDDVNAGLRNQENTDVASLVLSLAR